MRIHQMSISHDERQDRLLWRLNTLDGREFKFWLTRRMLTRLLPVLNQCLLKIHAAHPELVASDTASLQMVRDFKREDLLTRGDFKTPFASSTKEPPLGQEPLLVTEAHLSLNKPHSLGLVLEEQMGDKAKSCQLNLSSDLVEGLLVLVQQALTSADWGLADIQHTAPTPSPSPAGATSPASNYKH